VASSVAGKGGRIWAWVLADASPAPLPP
jgi:hypothetical protein